MGSKMQFNGNNIEIVFQNAVVVSGVLYLLLNTPPSVGKRWDVITDRDGRPVPHHRIEVLQIWSAPLGRNGLRRCFNVPDTPRIPFL